MKTGLDILEAASKYLMRGNRCASYFYFERHTGECTTFHICLDGIDMGQKSYRMLHGEKKEHLWEGSTVTKPMRWEEENGIALKKNKEYGAYTQKRKIYTPRQIAQNLPDVIEKCGIRMDPKDATLVFSTARFGPYSIEPHLVPKKPLMRFLRECDGNFTKSLEPRTEYFVKGELVSFSFPVIENLKSELDNRHIMERAVKFKTVETRVNNKSLRHMIETTSRIQSAIEAYGLPLEELLKNYMKLCKS